MEYKKPWLPKKQPTTPETHPYLTRKGVPLGEGCSVDGEKLLIPMSTGFNQEIYPDGRKHFPNGSKKGWYRVDGKSSVIFIAEGYATAYSVHLATGCTCYIAFDAGQLAKTAQEARVAFPDADIIIAADSDEGGLRGAEKAALTVFGTVAALPSSDNQQDWNDFWLANGKEATIKALNEFQYEPEPPEPELPRQETYYPPAIPQDFSKEDVSAMLACLSPDCSNDEWVRIGMAVKRGGFDCGLWDSWSAGSAKYKKGECWKRWGTFGDEGAVHFGTLVYLAGQAGWERPVQEYDPIKERGYALDTVPVDLVAIANRKLAKSKISTATKDFDSDPMKIEGLIGDTVRWICETAIFKQPLLALMNTIAFAGAVIGRTYTADPYDTRANIYLVGLVPTAGGKELSRKRIQELADAAGLDNFLGDNSVRSESGIARSLQLKASQLMMLDEFGMLMQSLSDERATHTKNVMKLITTLYNGNSLYKHGTYADAKVEQIKLRYPALSIYGTSTEATYAPALKKQAIESGELNRFIVLPNNSDPEPEFDLPDYNLPQDLIYRWREVGHISTNLTAINSGETVPVSRKVPYGECKSYMIDLMKEQHSHRNDKYAELWGRYRENVIKIGLIFSVLESPEDPVMLLKWLEFGSGMVKASITYMAHLADSNIAESQYHSWQQDIIKAIAKKGEMTQNELRRIMQKVEPRKFAELLSDMEQYGVIVRSEKRAARGRAASIFRLSGEDV